jgi:two-component system, NtrC family, sensor kinase
MMGSVPSESSTFAGNSPRTGDPPRRPSLRRRLAIAISIMVAGVFLIAAGAILGIERLHENLSVALTANGQLRQMYETGTQLTIAGNALDASPPDTAAAKRAVESAVRKLDPTFVSPDSPAVPWLDENARQAFQRKLQDIARQLPAASDAAAGAISDAIGMLSAMSSEVRHTIQASQQAADENRRNTLLLVASLAAVVAIAAVIAGIVQYRCVVKPLDKLSAGVRAFAAGDLDRRIDPSHADREFAALAADFNAMAEQLRSLYRDLSAQVAQKSKELVRSERLASVGYLAAGVAHEINNPLGIITGYGQRATQLLERCRVAGAAPPPETLQRTQKALEVMCEEAFRCKGITDRLLSLARPATGDRTQVSLKKLAEDVIANLSALPGARRPITLRADDEDDYRAPVSDGEIRQVLLNLVLNAQSATQGGGEIFVELKRQPDTIALQVSDTGRGMDPATLDRIFEPFYTDRRDGAPGTGLGLSITHAIIASHGGTIVAASDGAGKGSRFVVTLPAGSALVANPRGDGGDCCDCGGNGGNGGFDGMSQLRRT